MRVDSNVEAADELTVVQAIVPAAVRLGNTAHRSEHYDGLDDDSGDAGGDDGLDNDCDDDVDDGNQQGSPDDNESVVIGQDMLLRGESNRVPGYQHDH